MQANIKIDGNTATTETPRHDLHQQSRPRASSRHCKAWAPLSPLILRRLRTLRADNAHGIAYAVAAEALGLDALRVKLDAINAAHERAGYLTPELSEARRALYDELLIEARRMLSADEFNALYACF